MPQDCDGSNSDVDTSEHGGGQAQQEPQATTPSFFASRTYTSKDDVIASVVEYNHLHQRAYLVLTSDKRRYKVACVHPNCSFLVRFAFSSKFKPPTRFQPHDCSSDRSCATSDEAARHATGTASSSSSALRGEKLVVAPAEAGATTTTAAAALNRACRPKQITRYPEVRALFLKHGEQVKTAWITDVLVQSGLHPTYANCFHARKRLLKELADDPEKFAAQQQSSLLSLATFAASSPSAAANGKQGGDAASGTTTPRKGKDSDPLSEKKKKRKLEDAPFASASVEQKSEPEGCCFICPSVPLEPAENHHILQWQVRDLSSVKTFFDLYDDNRRIEILRTGTYRLHLYFETQGGTVDAAVANGASGNDAKYYLMVNNKPFNMFKSESSGNDQQVASTVTSGQSPESSKQARDDVQVGVFNVAEVQLKKWDMIVFRRTCNASSSADHRGATQTPFGRFIIEPVQEIVLCRV